MSHKSEANENPTSESKWENLQNQEDEAHTSELIETPAINTELMEALEKAEEWRGRYLRSEADKENLRKVHERDMEGTRKFALERFAKELLPVVDSLEKSLEHEADENLRQGVQMTLTLLLNVLQKFHITVIDPLQQPFNPTHHEAIAAETNPEFPANTVVKVLQKGYLLYDRLIRPAMVVVSK